MRLYEIVTPTLYLCTSTRQKDGAVVSLDDTQCPLGAEIENALERGRPEGRLARSKSIWLVLQPHAADFVYLVRPEGLERQHTGWLTKLADVDPTQPGVMAHFAHGYWSGEVCAEAQAEPWEYRAARVRILKRVGRSAAHDACF